MPSIEEPSAFLYTPASHELRYNRHLKTLTLVRTGDANARPDREIGQDRIAGSVSTLVRTIHHNLSVHFDKNPPSVEEAAATRWTIRDLAERMEHWLAKDDHELIEYATGWFHPDITASDDPLGWLRGLLGKSSSLIWQLFLSFHCRADGIDGSDYNEADDEAMVKMFVTMHLQAMYPSFVNDFPSVDKPGMDSRWIHMCMLIDELDTYFMKNVDRSKPRTLRHEAIMIEMVDAVEDLGLVDQFVHGVDPAVIWAALVKAVGTDGLAADDDNDDEADDEEVLTLVNLFICVAAFDVGKRPAEADAMMDCYTRSVGHPEVKDAIRRRARAFPSRIVVEPFRSRLELLSE